MKRAIAAVAGAGILGIVVALTIWPSSGPKTLVEIGGIDDFPVGSITALEVRASIPEPIPGIFDDDTIEVDDNPIFVVNDSVEGLLALWARDPHKGCRVMVAPDDVTTGGCTPARDIAFLTPCHGEKYDATGRWITGPSPRGLDRFGIAITDGRVAVNFADFRFGPQR